MDRIFLRQLVHELAPLVEGQRIRTVGADPERRNLELTTSSSQRHALIVSLIPDASGIFRGRLPSSGSPPPRLKKPLVGSRVVALGIAPSDRVITLKLEQTRLSGRRVELELRLEVLATRTDLYLLDASGVVLEALSSTRPRIGVGENHVALPPPPGANTMAESPGVFRGRLPAGDSFTRSELLFASGMSPLLVDEMRALIDAGRTPAEAFLSVSARLDETAPVLYVRPRSGAGGKPAVLAPVTLEIFSGWKARRFGSFEEALTESFELVRTSRSMDAAFQRLDSALRRALEKARKLQSKLGTQLSSLAEPSELRRRGERILAGLRSVTPLPDGWAELPDPFDVEGRTVRVSVDPRLSLTANAARYFRLSRKAERTARKVSERLSRLTDEIDYLEGLAMGLRDARSLAEMEALTVEAAERGLVPNARFEKKARRRGKEQRLPPRRFVTPGGNVVLVGRSGRSNDELTFRHAGPADLWFHVSGSPGSHVVLKHAESGEPDESEMRWAAALAAYFSKRRRDAHVDVMVTERRYVHKVKGGPPGLVRVSQSRTLRVSPAKQPDEERRE